MRLRNVGANMTVGDIGVTLQITTNEDMTGYDLEVIIVKPSGATITRSTTSISMQNAFYVTADGDIDEDGKHFIFLRNNTVGFEYDPGNNTFMVRPRAEDQAVWV